MKVIEFAYRLDPELEVFATWLENEPEAPAGKWFKRFPEMTVCGEGE